MRRDWATSVRPRRLDPAPGTPKKHNWTTGLNQKYVDSKVNGTQVAAICSCNHLTPLTEARMDNLIIPTREEVIKRNSPGGDLVVVMETPIADWDTEEPSKQALDEIEHEESRVTC